MKSKLFWVNAKDFIKGMVIAILSGILSLLTTLTGIEDNELVFKKVIIASAIGFLSYLIKNLFTNSKDRILTKEIK